MRYYFIIFIILLFATGCVRLKEWDEKVGEVFFSEEPSSSSPSFWDDFGKETKFDKKASSSEVLDIDIKEYVKSLTKEQKERIENWLKENSLNRYGDKQDTYYTGGTPLFNEETGETKGRFEYILENHGEIVGKLGL